VLFDQQLQDLADKIQKREDLIDSEVDDRFVVYIADHKRKMEAMENENKNQADTIRRLEATL